MKNQDRQIQVNGKECSLTQMEFEVFQWMRRHQGSVVSRDALLRNVWGFPVEADTRSVDMCIRRLRSKIGFGAIRTVYGKGYVLTMAEA